MPEALRFHLNLFPTKYAKTLFAAGEQRQNLASSRSISKCQASPNHAFPLRHESVSGPPCTSASLLPPSRDPPWGGSLARGRLTSLESSCWLMTASASSAACRLASATVRSILARSDVIMSCAFRSASDTAFCSSVMACRFTSLTASSAGRAGGPDKRTSWLACGRAPDPSPQSARRLAPPRPEPGGLPDL